MSYFYILIGLVAGFFVGKRFGSTGVSDINAAKRKAREEALEKVMGLFNQKQEITNDDVQQLLGVSDTTATNYLEELERQDRIVQIGIEGRAVTYRHKRS